MQDHAALATTPPRAGRRATLPASESRRPTVAEMRYSHHPACPMERLPPGGRTLLSAVELKLPGEMQVLERGDHVVCRYDFRLGSKTLCQRSPPAPAQPLGGQSTREGVGKTFQGSPHGSTVSLRSVVYARGLLAELHNRLGPQVLIPLSHTAARLGRFDSVSPGRVVEIHH